MKKTIICALSLAYLLFVFISCRPSYEQKFVNTDVTNFWEAYDKITATTDTSLQKQYLHDLFLKKGSPGLESLAEVRRYTPELYLEVINSYPKFWNSIRSNTLEADTHFAEIDASVKKLKALYPELKPATIYFLMGAFRTNGTILEDQILIGSEMALSSKKVDISELPEHPQEFNRNHNPIDDIVFLCTHEYVHTQQKPLVDNLLSYCLYEGIPEFVATLATGKKSYSTAIEYGENNYEQVRDRFEEEMYRTYRTYSWLWSSNRIFGERDLGYAVGFGMAKRYYEKARDKQAAIKEMIELDFEDETAVARFVDKSGYLTKPVKELSDNYEKARPIVQELYGVENGSQNVKPGETELTFEFSQPLSGTHTGVDYGPDTTAVFPALLGERTWGDDNKSWTITADLKPNQHYQILISENFRLADGVQLKPYLVDFKTSE